MNVKNMQHGLNAIRINKMKYMDVFLIVMKLTWKSFKNIVPGNSLSKQDQTDTHRKNIYVTGYVSHNYVTR